MEIVAFGKTGYVPFLEDAVNADSQQKNRRGAGRLAFIGGLAGLLSFSVAVWLWRSNSFNVSQISSLATSQLNGFLATSIPVESEKNTMERQFALFSSSFSKTYQSSEEKDHRFSIFRENMAYIELHNRQNFTYSLRMNEFGDMTFDEFRLHYTSIHLKEKHREGKLKSGSRREVEWTLLDGENVLPEAVDWRERGCVTEIKNQEKCGSCWAFSTTGAIEGAMCAQTGVLPNLSEQQLVDCAHQGNLGCDGGEPDWAFQYVVNQGGLCREEEYPYTSHEIGFCAANDCEPVGGIQGFRDVPPMSERALRAALAKYGPVAVSIEADQAPFQFYHDGVFNGPCGAELDHAVLAVGYGTDPVSGLDYFIVKNSWGMQWGEGGFMRMVRTEAKHHDKHHQDNGECGILSDPSFVLV